VIRRAAMRYARYPLSLRQIEDLLFERGIDICHETVRSVPSCRLIAASGALARILGACPTWLGWRSPPERNFRGSVFIH